MPPRRVTYLHTLVFNELRNVCLEDVKTLVSFAAALNLLAGTESRKVRRDKDTVALLRSDNFLFAGHLESRRWTGGRDGARERERERDR